MDFLKFCENHPQFFANGNIALPQSAREKIAEFVKVIDFIQKNAPFFKNESQKTAGVLMGFDFHLGDSENPKLIEINTNAGGAFLNVALLEKNGKTAESQNLAENLISMFRREWRLFSNDSAPLKNVAIVDDSPESQFLFPEFLIAQSLFEKNGIAAEIADPAEFEIQNNALILKGKKVDLVYNRLTDFYLNAPQNAVLKRVFLENLACISPNPAHYEKIAKKDLLMILRNPEESWGLSDSQKALLADTIPKMEIVDSEEFWNRRKSLFFKPAEGFGSRAVYRGDKITKKVFGEILENHYLAQSLVPPNVHEILVGGEKVQMKADIRAFAYQNEILHFAARLYVGQTTNFRTAGGGFALCV